MGRSQSVERFGHHEHDARVDNGPRATISSRSVVPGSRSITR